MYIHIQLVKTAAGALQALLCAPDVQVRILPPPYALRACRHGQICELPCVHVYIHVYMNKNGYACIYIWRERDVHMYIPAAGEDSRGPPLRP